jgi:hypothetical protein
LERARTARKKWRTRDYPAYAHIQKAKDYITKRDESAAFFLPKKFWLGLHQAEGEEYIP